MAQTIKLKRSGTQNAVPSTSQLALGEVALNTYDGKMYIKKSVGGTESIVEIGGDATSSSGLDFTGNLNLADDVRIVIGDGNDLQIFHDGSHSYIKELGTGNLRIDANDFFVRNAAATQIKIGAEDGGAVKLYYAGVKKFETTSTGATVSGELVADTATTTQIPLSIGGSSAGSYTLQRWITSAHSGSEAYIIAYGAGHGSEAGNFAIKNLEANSNIFFELANSVEPLRLTSSGITVTGDISLSGNIVDSDQNEIINIDQNDIIFNGKHVQSNFGVWVRRGGTSTNRKAGIDSDSQALSLQFYTDSTEHIRIDADGRLLVNTTSSIDNLAKIQVVGDSSSLARITLQDVDGTNQKTFFEQSGGGTRISTQDGTSNGIFTIGAWNGTASSDFVRVTSTGRVGIGTVNPDHPLHVSFSGDDGAQIKSTDNHASLYINAGSGYGSYIRFEENNAQNYWINADTNGRLLFRPGGGSSNWITFDSNGRIGIGTTSPGRKLTVQGASGDNLPVRIIGGSGTSHGSMEFQDPNTTADYKVAIGSKGDAFYVQAGGSERVRIHSGGQLGIGVTDFTNALRSSGKQLIIGDCFIGTSAALVVDDFSRFAAPIYFHQDSGTNAANSTAIDNNGSRLVITGKNGTTANALDAPDGFYVGGTQFITSSRQITNVTSITATGAISTTGTASLGAINVGSSTSGNVFFKRPNANYIFADQSGGYLVFGTNGRSTSVANSNFYLGTNKDVNFQGSISVVSNATISGETKTDSLLVENPSTIGHTAIGSITNDEGSGYIRSSIVMTRDEDQITYNGSTDTWTHAGGSQTDWSMITHSANAGFQVYSGAAVSSSTNYTHSQFNDAYRHFQITAAGKALFYGNVQLDGTLQGPATFTIDPATHGDDTGTVVIAGNLQVDGTTTTINSTTLTVDDKNITLASGSINKAAANGAGLTVDCGSDTDATFTYNGTNDQWELNKILKWDYALATTALDLNNNNIVGVNNISFADPGGNEGLQWTNIKVFESPNDLSNTSGNFQVTYGGTRRFTVDNTGIDVVGKGKFRGSADGASVLELGQLDNDANTPLVTVYTDDGGSARPFGGDTLDFNTLRYGQQIGATRGSAAGGNVRSWNFGTTTNGDERGIDLFIYSQGDSSATGSTGTSINVQLSATSNRNSYINTGGNFGLGTATPTHKLHVASTSPSLLLQKSDETGRQTNISHSSGLTKIRSRNNSTNGQITFEGYTSSTTTEYARFDASGKLGIGLSSPTYKLDISAGSAIAARFTGGDSNGITSIFTRPSEQVLKTWSGNSYYSGLVAGAHFQIFTNNSSGTPRVTVLDTGNVGIGTIAPATNLHVNGTWTANRGTISINGPANALTGVGITSNNIYRGGLIHRDGTAGQYLELTAYSSEALLLRTTNTTRLSIAAAGAITFNNAFTFPTTDGSANQILKTDGSGNVTWATEAAVSANTSISDADGDTKIQTEEGTDDDTIRFDTAGAQRMLIDAAGNVGINSSSLTKTLNVGGTFLATGEAFFSHFDNTTSSSRMRDDLRLNFGTARTFAITGNSTNMHMKNGTSDVITLDTASNVGIGTSSPATRLHVSGAYGTPQMRIGYDGTAGNGIFFHAQGGSTHINWLVGQQRSLQGFEITPSTAVGGTTFSTPAFVINTGGDVGIGTTSPSTKLHIQGSFDPDDALGYALIENTNTTSGGQQTNSALNVKNYHGTSQFMQWEENGLRIGSRIVTNGGNGDLYFTAGADSVKMFVKASNGHVGIGTTNPVQKLQVDGSIYANGGRLFVNNNSGISAVGDLVLQTHNGSGYQTSMHLDGADNHVGIGTASPDKKLTVDGDIKVGNGDAFMSANVAGSTRSLISLGTDNILRIKGNDAEGSSNVISMINGGKVGIGTTAPADRLEIRNNHSQLRLTDSDDNKFVQFSYSGGFLAVRNNNASTSVNLFSLTETGDFSIGTLNPASRLHVKMPNLSGGNNGNGLLIADDGAELKLEIRKGTGGVSGNRRISLYEDGGSFPLYLQEEGGNVGIGIAAASAVNAKLQVEELGIDTTTTTTSATTQVAIDTMAAATFRSAEFTIQVTNSTDSTYHLTKVLLIHDGTTPGITEYGTVFTGSAAEATFNADISSGNVRLLATPASTDSMTFKVVRHCITV